MCQSHKTKYQTKGKFSHHNCHMGHNRVVLLPAFPLLRLRNAALPVAALHCRHARGRYATVITVHTGARAVIAPSYCTEQWRQVHYEPAFYWIQTLRKVKQIIKWYRPCKGTDTDRSLQQGIILTLSCTELNTKLDGICKSWATIQSACSTYRPIIFHQLSLSWNYLGIMPNSLWRRCISAI